MLMNFALCNMWQMMRQHNCPYTISTRNQMRHWPLAMINMARLIFKTPYLRIFITYAAVSKLTEIPEKGSQTSKQHVKTSIQESGRNVPCPHLPRIGAYVGKRMSIPKNDSNFGQTIRIDCQSVNRNRLICGRSQRCECQNQR